MTYLLLLLPACLQVQRHQFMGNQAIKMFAPKDDEVRLERPSSSWWLLIDTDVFLCVCTV